MLLGRTLMPGKYLALHICIYIYNIIHMYVCKLGANTTDVSILLYSFIFYTIYNNRSLTVKICFCNFFIHSGNTKLS